MKPELRATRQLTTAEQKRLDAMLDRAFGDDDIGCQYQWTTNDWNLWLESEGEIISHVGVVDRTVLAGTQAVRVGGVGAVATAPEWRRRGCARQLMETAAAFMRDEIRVAAGLLICDEHMLAYYSRLGWQAVPGPLLVDQPQGKVMMPANIMVLLFGERRWPDGTIDLCSLPW